MQFLVTYGTEEPRSEILDKKMKEIRSYDDFLALQEEYGWLPCIASFHATWRFHTNWVEDQLAEFFFDELLSYAIESRIKEVIDISNRSKNGTLTWLWEYEDAIKQAQPDNTI